MGDHGNGSWRLASLLLDCSGSGEVVRILHLFRMFAAAAAAVLLPTGWAAAVEQGNAAASAQRIVIRFNPPLDQPLRYRHSKQVTRGTETSTRWSLTEYTFSRRAGGFRLRVRLLESGVDGGDPVIGEAYRRAAQSFSRPYFLLLDDVGAIVGMEDEEAYWTEMLRLTEQMFREREAQATPAHEAAIASVVGAFRDTPPQARLATLAGAAASIVQFASAELTPGQESWSEVDTPTVVGTTVRQRLRTTAERVEDGHLIVGLQGSVPREELVRNMELFLSRVSVAGEGSDNEEGRARALADVRSGAMSQRSEARYEVDLTTGLTRRYRRVEHVEVAFGDENLRQVSTVALDRLE